MSSVAAMTIRSARRGVTVGVVAATALAVTAGAADAQTVKGTVVHRNARAQSFVIAQPNGRMLAIHARTAPRIGTRVIVSVSRLHNGTFAAKRVRITGRRHSVRLKGTVSYVNRASGFFTLSSRGVSMLVREKRGHAASMAAALPAVGTQVTATGMINPQGELEDQSLQTNGSDTNGFSVEGVIMAIDVSARTLTVSADDSEQSGTTITVAVPAALDLSKFAVGEEVELEVTLQPDGTYQLQGSASDAGSAAADDQGEQQGDQGDDDQGDQQTPTQSASKDGAPAQTKD